MAEETNAELAIIAVNRFGLGARSGELKQAKVDPQQWLIKQLQAIKFSTDLPSSQQVFEIMAEYRKNKSKAKQQFTEKMQTADMQNIEMSDPANTSNNKGKSKKDKNTKLNPLKSTYRTLTTDTFKQAMLSENSLSFRLLDFFSNHFSVSAQGNFMVPLAGTLEREAINDNLLGRFEDMLLAVSKHPAMLVYLNNEKSVGPTSRASKKNRGLNENLAREILELHTLGVNGGYQQADVIELAKGITGWSVAIPKRDKRSGFLYRAHGHEPGRRNLLGVKYSQQGVKQGEAMLRDLARHPNTSKHICTKLVRHFISDSPSPQLVDALQARWQATNGNIKEVMITLINHQQSWLPEQQKFKTPREFVLSVLRALGVKKIKEKQLFFVLQSLGQMPMQAGSPAGYSDEQQDWNGGSALMSRIEWVARVAKSYRANAEKIMQQTLALPTSNRTYKSVIRAESREAALTLLLMSPEFLRR